MFCRKSVFENFAKFTGKFDKVAELRAATLLKKRFWHLFYRANTLAASESHIKNPNSLEWFISRKNHFNENITMPKVRL